MVLAAACGGDDDDAPADVGAEAPLIGDHWHTAFGVYECGAFQPNPVDAAPDTFGIHTHGDGLIHVHPFVPEYTGAGATLGAFLLTVPMDVDSPTACGTPEVYVWDDADDPSPTLAPAPVTDVRLRDGQVLVISRNQGQPPPLPPSATVEPTDV